MNQYRIVTINTRTGLVAFSEWHTEPSILHSIVKDRNERDPNEVMSLVQMRDPANVPVDQRNWLGMAEHDLRQTQDDMSRVAL